MVNKITNFILSWSLMVFLLFGFLTTNQSLYRYNQNIILEQELNKLKIENLSLKMENLDLKGENEGHLLTIETINKQLDFERTIYDRDKESFFQRGEELNDYDISRSSNRSLEEIQYLLENTPLECIATTVFIMGKKYDINELFIISVAQLESAHGSSNLAMLKNNLFGLNAWGATGEEIFDRAFDFKDKSECVVYFTEMIIENYFSAGRTTIFTIGQKYAEDPNWGFKVKNIMKWNLTKLKERSFE